MKEKRKWFMRWGIVVVIVVAPIIWLSTTPMGYLLFPPKGLYTPLVLDDLDLSKKGSVIDVKFRNKYKGSHDLGIYVSNHLENDAKFNFQLKITVSGENGVIIDSIFTEQEFLFWGWEQGKSGVALFVYEAPEELPLNKALRIRAEVLEPDKEFYKKHGPTMFFVRKMSDK